MPMIHVMLIDDEEDALNLLEILLKQFDEINVVGRYLNPKKAVEALATTQVDAIFLDNQMPGMSGIEVARIIRKSHPRLPIVFTTAYSEYAVEAFEIESTDYLLKPITMSRLQIAVSRIHDSISISQIRSATNDGTYIRCMGGFQVPLPNTEIKLLPWRTNKEKEVCAFLVHHEGKSVDTTLLIESIWPGYDTKRAKSYLYTCLSYLRRNVQQYNIPIKVEKIDNGFTIIMQDLVADATELEGLLTQVLSARELDEKLYNWINGLYQGEYMEDCDYHWAVARQEALRSKYVRTLRRMYKHFRDQGNEVLVADSLQRIFALAPESEEEGRELIKFYLEAGNRIEALRVYRQLEQAIRDQLDVDLEDETIQLYNKLLNRGKD